MIGLPPAVRIYVCSQPTDMRRSFDGLAAMVTQLLRQDPFSGHLFVFGSRRRDRIKVLFWDRSGYSLWYKRLERGVFHFPPASATTVELEASELVLLLEGIDLTGARRQPRYVPGRLHAG